MSSALIPVRRAMETIRLTASDWDGQPQARPGVEDASGQFNQARPRQVIGQTKEQRFSQRMMRQDMSGVGLPRSQGSCLKNFLGSQARRMGQALRRLHRQIEKFL